jgi:gliding motility-associated lipoprotein GldH
MTTRKTSSYIRIAGGIICLLFSLAACDNQTIYHTYQNLSIEGWKKTDTLKYQLPAQLAGKQYDLEVGLRHTENYPYQDIWMEILYPLSPDRHPIPSISHWQDSAQN